MEDKNLVPAEHIGDGLYMKDNEWNVAIAVNHHLNEVAYIDMSDIDRAIEYLQKVKERIKLKQFLG
jgi:hypothetical protein